MPKFYCEYCGVYLTHSSPSGRKQHCRGRKHINNKIEYYNQLLIDQNQSGLLGNSSLKAGSMNPFARPLLPNLPFNIPGMMPSMNPGAQSNINAPHINLPGILPSNITNLPMMPNNQGPDPKNPQGWPPNNMMQQMSGPNQMGQIPMNPGQMPPGQMMSGPMGQGQMQGLSMNPNMNMGMPGMQLMNKGGNNGIGLGNYMGNNNMNPGGTFIHPANVQQNEQGYRK